MTKAKSNNTESKKTATADEQQPTLSHMLGEIFWLLGRSHGHSFLFLRDLDWMIYPPVHKRQFFVFHNEEKKPVALALWAYVNEETEKRLVMGMNKLKPEEWKNGDSLWLVDLVAPFGKQDLVLEQLKGSIFAGKSFKYQKRNKEGKLEIVEESGFKSENQTEEKLADIQNQKAAAEVAKKHLAKQEKH